MDSPYTPSNLSIDISGSDIVLTWHVVAEAVSYKIYSSGDPNESFETWDYEDEVSETTWSGSIPPENRFYYVTAVSGIARDSKFNIK